MKTETELLLVGGALLAVSQYGKEIGAWFGSGFSGLFTGFAEGAANTVTESVSNMFGGSPAQQAQQNFQTYTSDLFTLFNQVNAPTQSPLVQSGVNLTNALGDTTFTAFNEALGTTPLGAAWNALAGWF